eukprot:8928255-Karenia_brevis.AAC.1
MRMYAILFVSYFEELNECDGSLTDLPIPTSDSRMLVERAQKLKEGDCFSFSSLFEAGLMITPSGEGEK